LPGQTRWGPPTDNNTDDVAQPAHKESVNIVQVARDPYACKDKDKYVFAINTDLLLDKRHVFLIDKTPLDLPDLFEINYESDTTIETEPPRTLFDVLDEANPLRSPFVDIMSSYFPRYVDDDIPPVIIANATSASCSH